MTLFNDLNIRHIVLDDDSYVSLSDLCNHFIGAITTEIMRQAETMHTLTLKQRIFFAGFVEGASSVANSLAEMKDVQTLHTRINTVEDLIKRIEDN